MSDDSQSSFRELTVGGIFRESLVLYREMWAQLLRIVAPSAIISAIVYFFIFARQPDFTGTPSAPATAPATLSFVALMLFLSLAVTTLGITAISERFLGASVTISRAYLRFADVFFPFTRDFGLRINYYRRRIIHIRHSRGWLYTVGSVWRPQWLRLRAKAESAPSREAT